MEFALCMPLLVIWTVSLRRAPPGMGWEVLQRWEGHLGRELSAICVLCVITIGKGGEGRDGRGGEGWEGHLVDIA